MTSVKARTCAALLVAFSLSATAGEAFAQAPTAPYGDPRANALRDCTARERQASPSIKDSNLSMYVFRACMNAHGQPE